MTSFHHIQVVHGIKMEGNTKVKSDSRKKLKMQRIELL